MIMQIGVAMKELFSTGIVKRDEMWITSKLWFVSLYTFLTADLLVLISD